MECKSPVASIDLMLAWLYSLPASLNMAAITCQSLNNNLAVAPLRTSDSVPNTHLDFCQTLTARTQNKTATDKESIAIFMRYASDEQKEEWECLDEYIAKNYAAFKARVKQLYGKGADEVKYTMRTWNELIDDYAMRPCNSSTSFSRFLLRVRPQYTYLINSLQMTNFIAVRDIGKCVEPHIWQATIQQLKSEDTANPPATAQPANDPYTASRILNAIYDIFKEHERSAVYVSTSHLPAVIPTQRAPVSVKREDVNIKLEQFMQENAEFRDKQLIQTNKLQSTLESLNSILQNSQIKNHNVAVGRYNSQPQQYGSGSSMQPQHNHGHNGQGKIALSKATKDQCLACELEGHFIRDCEAWKELKRLKRVKPAPNRMGFLTGDGQQILESWPGRTICDKINHYYNQVKSQNLSAEFMTEDEFVFQNMQSLRDQHDEDFPMVQ